MKVFIRRLGCPKNDVDADYLAARLISAGHQVVGSVEEAEIAIINTCGFIQPAKEESIEEILGLAQLKEAGKLKRVYASGCLSQRYGTELLKEMPELDGAFGVGELEAISETLADSRQGRPAPRTNPEAMSYIGYEKRAVSDALPYAYLKISDGCDRTCAFCAIPSIRGHYRSRPMPELVAEAQDLVAAGKKELILVSQEATLYGADLKAGYGLIDLLQTLGEIPNLEWVRLLYLYPSQVSDELIKHLADPDTKTLSYFDLPLQHISDRVLTAMKRRTGREKIEALIDRIREADPESVIRTAFIVGFPGETEVDFQELCDFVEERRFDRLGGFMFSAEEGTPAAGMTGQVSEAVRAARLDTLLTLQQGIAFERNNSLIGTVHEVIIDAVHDDAGRAVGRTMADCPEIDQDVQISGAGCRVGEIRQVRIDAADGYELIGTLLRD
jgi:ribosomal protein S12 methylthiotransferase